MPKILAAIAALALCLAPAACTRGGSREKTGAPKQAARENPRRLALDPYWEKGELPPSVMEGAPVDGGTLHFWLPQQPNHLVGLIEPDWWLSRMTEGNVFEALVWTDPDDAPNYRQFPALAESWEVSPDHLTYTFKLRKGVTFHDGKPLTADDVIFTFDKLMDPKVKSASLRSYFEDLAGWKKLDPYTVQFRFKKPYWMALSMIGEVYILPKHVYQDGDFNKHPKLRAPVGSGPFKFEKWEEGKQIVFSRHDGYWGDRKPHIEKLVWKIVDDSSVALQLMERGEIDVGLRLTAEQYVNLPKSKKLVDNFWRVRIPDANYAWVGWNQKKPFFADARVRKALALLTPMKEMHEKLFHRLYEPTTCHFYFKSAACDPAHAPLPHDPKEAMRLLEEAGWRDTDKDGVLDKDGVPFRFTYLYSVGSTTAEQMGLIMKEAFHKAGIEMDLAKTEWALFTKRLREHEFDAVTLAWGGGPIGDPWQIWHSSSVNDGSNYVFFQNKQADKLIEDARTEFDADRRNAMYRAFGKILYDEQPYMWIGMRPHLGLVHRKIKGAKVGLDFVGGVRDWWIDPAWKEASAPVQPPATGEAAPR